MTGPKKLFFISKGNKLFLISKGISLSLISKGNKLCMISERKSLWLIAYFLILSTILTACTHENLPFIGGFFKKAPEQITLRYWGLWEPESVVKPLIEEFQSTHPNVTIQYEKRSIDRYRETLQSRLSSGEGPDVFRFHNSWLPMLVNDVSPVPEAILSNSAIESTFYPTVKNDLRASGKYYGIPLEYDGLALIYNEDMFKAAGLDKPPTTWDQLRKDYAPRLTVKEDEGRKLVVAGVALGTQSNVEHFSDILGLMMLQNGAQMIKDGKVNFHKSISSDVPSRNLGADALSFYTVFVKDDKVWSDEMPPSVEAFARGKVAMILAPSYRIFDILNLMERTNQKFSFKVAPVPQLAGGRSQVSWAGYWAEGVSSKSANKQAAWEFVKFLSEKESLRKLYTQEAKIRSFGEPYSRVDLANLVSNDPYVGAYISQAPYAKSWYMHSRTFDNGINDRTIKFFSDAVNDVLKGMGSAEALEKAEAGVTQVLTSYGLISKSAPAEPARR